MYLCSWARLFTLTLGLSTSLYLGVQTGRGRIETLVLTLCQTSIHPGGVEFAPSLNASVTWISCGGLDHFSRRKVAYYSFSET